VLVLGGTGEARALAARLSGDAIPVVSSLAGRVSNPALPVGDVRIGGFGGAAGLARYLDEAAITAVIDATHPFAATITNNAVIACAEVGRPLVVLRRPGWHPVAGDQWLRVPDIGAAARLVAARPPGTVFLTTGKRDLNAFSADSAHPYLVRAVDPPSGPGPARMTLLLDRGPYVVERERQLMAEHGVTVLVTKDSGGEMTSAKLTAARELSLPVVMVDRPAVPIGAAVIDSVDAAVAWVDSLARGVVARREHPAADDPGLRRSDDQ
jgi:precorrin-6A/cobalt-precorrin-6A reductase